MQGDTFRDTGFFSDEIRSWQAKMVERNREYIELALDANRRAMRALYQARAREDDVRRTVTALLFGRAVQAFQGSVLMGIRGMAAEARTLTRNLAETAIALGATAAIEDFHEQLLAAHGRHTLRLANALIADPASATMIDDGDRSAFQGVAAEIRAEHGGDPPPIDWAAVAGQVGMEGLYNTVYRDMSNDGTHVSVNSLNRHVRADGEGNIKSFKFEPTDDDFEWTTSAALLSLLAAMDALFRLFPLAPIHSDLLDLSRRFEQIKPHSEKPGA